MYLLVFLEEAFPNIYLTNQYHSNDDCDGEVGDLYSPTAEAINGTCWSLRAAMIWMILMSCYSMLGMILFNDSDNLWYCKNNLQIPLSYKSLLFLKRDLNYHQCNTSMECDQVVSDDDNSCHYSCQPSCGRVVQCLCLDCWKISPSLICTQICLISSVPLLWMNVSLDVFLVGQMKVLPADIWKRQRGLVVKRAILELYHLNWTKYIVWNRREWNMIDKDDILFKSN